ncbi:FAD-binding domain-containing protein [Rhodocollybia butyracea]|uniref:FAD-binding domain-containing protein n=1 Tax=Rhodocollybia butyracea TaxID=206335 RepID=A0A9P5Q2J0_9AGAR|nr:FAD-binding domain-containing protein [Rhodocollybia butyracea]
MNLILPSLALVVGTAQSTKIPPTSEWNTLNKTVGGRLFTAKPFASPCFSDFAGLPAASNEAECNTVQENYLNTTFRSSQFNNFMIPIWESCMDTDQQCALDSSDPSNPLAFSDLPCYQGSVAPYHIEIETFTDVQAAFNFSKATGVPLSIKNSGHDYLGRSGIPGSLALWTRHLEQISYNASFIPEGGSHSFPAMTIGAGVPWQDAYSFADANNVTIVGGYDQTVGASGGWVMGGGHSDLSPVFGLGVDRVLQFKLVTPDGVYRTANAYTNSDLFWALRGGGGGTFGVVLESTTLVEPTTIPLQVASVSFDATGTNSSVDFLQLLTENSLGWAQAGWGSHMTLSGLVSINPLLTLDQARESMQNITEYVQSQNGSVVIETLPSWYAFFVKYVIPSQSPIGIDGAIATRLIPASVFETQKGRNSLVEVISNAAPFLLTISAVTPFLFNYTENSTSVTPAWRDSLWHVVLGDLWSWNTTTEGTITAFETLNNLTAALTDIAPNSGAYMNEANVYEPNYEQTFWGSNYPRLLAVKQKYDPEGLLDCWRCVGWKGENDSRSQCYLKVD